MPSAVAVGGFMTAATLIALVWGRALWYLTERTQVVRSWVFFAMGYTQRQFSEVRALLLSAIYYALGLLAALLLAIAFRLHLPSLISFAPSHVAWTLLGIVGEISLANLLIDLSVRLTGTGSPERTMELRDIPWMKGIRELPPAAVPFAAAIGGVVEEIFFRGIVLRIMTDRLAIAPMLAVAIAGALFVFQQLVQLQTPFQAMVIGAGCISISLVGGILVVQTGSILPALLSHASFVLFFMSQGNAAPANSYRPKAEMAAR